MAENSGIEWATHTWNPWRGCTKVSEACRHCYAETLAGRNPKTLGVWGPNGTRVVAAEAQWREPVKWNKAASHEARGRCSCSFPHPPHDWCDGNPKGEAFERPRVFCASLADVFEDWSGPMVNAKGERLKVDHGGTLIRDGGLIPGDRDMTMGDVRKRLFDLIDATPNLDWLLLTKRPENVLRFAFDAWCKKVHHASQNEGDGRRWAFPPNVWLGTTVENQAAADERIPHLLRVPAAVRFLSCEPLLGPVDLTRIRIPLEGESFMTRSAMHATDSLNKGAATPGRDQRIDWVICGGESGPGARPMHPAWAKSLRDQCVAAGVPFFYKQWGEYACHEVKPKDAGVTIDPPLPVEGLGSLQLVGGPTVRPFAGTASTADVFAPGNLLAVKLGKKAAGRLLDGREWNQFPEVPPCPR